MLMDVEDLQRQVCRRSGDLFIKYILRRRLPAKPKTNANRYRGCEVTLLAAEAAEGSDISVLE